MRRVMSEREEREGCVWVCALSDGFSPSPSDPQAQLADQGRRLITAVDGGAPATAAGGS